MSEDNKYYAYFTVVGDFDPNAITERVGVRPTECWRKGDMNPRNHLERKFSRWSLRSRLLTTTPLESHVTDVLDQLDTNPLAFKEISAQRGGAMQLVAYFHSSYPGVHFEKEVVQYPRGYTATLLVPSCDLQSQFDGR